MPIRAKTRRSTQRRRSVPTAHKNGRSHTVRKVISFAPVHRPTPGINTFSKAMRFLATLADYERLRIVRYNSQNFDLERMRGLLKRLGNPHDHFRSVHVAGTKGKGSTCAMIAAMLQANGYKVGLYTSPHLTDIRERIQVNGQMISHAEFAKLVRQVEPVVARLKPTPREKAGIFKHGIPAVTITQDPDAEAVLKEVAEKVGAPLDITGKSIEFSYRFESSRLLGPHNRICLTTPSSKFEHLAVPLIGEHQALNCGLALSIIDRLKARGFAISDTKAMEGLAKTKLAGRMEM